MFIKQAVYLLFLTVSSLLRHLCLHHTVFFFLAAIVFFLNFGYSMLGAYYSGLSLTPAIMIGYCLWRFKIGQLSELR